LLLTRCSSEYVPLLNYVPFYIPYMQSRIYVVSKLLTILLALNMEDLLYLPAFVSGLLTH
jgi:hypothetical protein